LPNDSHQQLSHQQHVTEIISIVYFHTREVQNEKQFSAAERVRRSPVLLHVVCSLSATEFHNVIHGQISGALIELVCSLLSPAFSVYFFSESRRVETIFRIHIFITIPFLAYNRPKLFIGYIILHNYAQCSFICPFFRAAWNASATSDEKGVCLSV